jgi:AcrR family transcriptional regulator
MGGQRAARTRRQAGRRPQVLRAAEALFARHGYHGVGLREIAAQVGIRAPSLFKHFPSKKALYNAVLGATFDRLAELTHVLEADVSYGERLRRYVHGYVDLIAEDPHFVPLIIRAIMERPEAIEPDVRDHALALHRRVDAMLRRGQRAGAFAPVDPLYFHFALTGALLFHGLAAQSYLLTVGGADAARDLQAWKNAIWTVVRGALEIESPQSTVHS